MKLKNGFEQAVCIIALLATQDAKIPVSSQVINKILDVSPTYLRKIFRKLVVAELVISVPGNNGGFTLAKGCEDISLRQVVESLEGPISTYPSTGLADRVFENMQSGSSSIMKPGDLILKEAFLEADKLWLSALEQRNVKNLIQMALGVENIPIINWNETESERELLIRKVLKRIHGNS